MTLAIKTAEGWKPLLPPMKPTPVERPFWRFGGSAAYDALFDDGKGGDLRKTGGWLHRQGTSK